MTASELAGLLGRRGTLEAGGFRIGIVILDAKQAYGVDRVFVESPMYYAKDRLPVRGRWVNLDRVTLEETEDGLLMPAARVGCQERVCTCHLDPWPDWAYPNGCSSCGCHRP